MNQKRSIISLSLVGLVAGAAACASDELGTEEGFETWNDANNPAFVDKNFVYDVAKLPVEGQTALTPIPADYWATYRDAINYRWDGTSAPSPAEKFGKAFGKAGVEAAVSRQHGIDAQAGSRKACKKDSDCTSLKDGSSCAMRRGKKSGYCIPTWWGLCHGWAPYAISEPAAVKPVKRNGVTFYPGDIEGLMTLVYSENLRVRFLSERCDEDEPKVADSGRIPDGECRDMNPGTLHILATNMLGIRKVGFVEDRTYDDEVWNQPVRGFRVTNAKNGKLLEIAKKDAVALVGLPAGSEYTYNKKAKRFFNVELDLDYVSEAPPAHTSHVEEIDYYTNTDHYGYVIEADAKGKVIGGEWVGESREFHPDFAWWPTAKPSGTVAEGKIGYEEVRALNEEAAKQ
ncbi:MAG: hypothetical protein HY744_31965 [Deltaproteobacteria bacterium]|nr:hypothetical protein [Deltaproteobacteria bacterium]